MKTVLLLLTDQFADWEAAYVSPELNKKDGKYKIKVITEDNKPKVSMGGVTVIPESGIDDCKIDDNIAMLIIPGGETWLENKSEKIKGIIKDCFEKNIPVAAICNAVTFLAENGFLEKNKHTGNSVEYMKACAPNYKGEQNYINKQAVRDGNLITANGSAAVEFSREILEKLEVFDENKLKEWYNTFKKGYL